MNKPLNNSVKNIAIVVDDANKNKLIEWSYFNKELLRHHHIIAADEIALILSGTLTAPVSSIPRGSLGGYRQLANMISNLEVDMLICLGNTEKANNFQTGISDLIALAVEKNVMLACNESTSAILLKAVYFNPHSSIADSMHIRPSGVTGLLQDVKSYEDFLGNLPAIDAGVQNN